MSDKPTFRLRPLEEKDLEAVAVFEGEIAKISFPDDPITDINFYVKKLKQLMANKDAAAFVAESGGEVVGWANVSQRQNFITKEKYADFHSIYVAPSQRGGGVVAALVEAVFDHCRQQEHGQGRVPHPRRQRAHEVGAGTGRLRADADLLREGVRQGEGRRGLKTVIASAAKQSSLAAQRKKLDCFVAALLAMTAQAPAPYRAAIMNTS